jgi:hypothetical protein
MLGSPRGFSSRCKLMPSRLLTLLLVPLMAFVVACGSDEQLERASATTDASQLLRDTVASSAKLKSARLELAATAPGVQAHVTGPFASDGKGKLPRFAFSVTSAGGGKAMRGGITWTGEKGFITLDNTAYAVSDLIVRQIEAGFEQAAANGHGPLGLDVARWLKDPRNEGAAQVGDAQTIKLTGTADVARVLDDMQALAGQAGSLGLPGGAVPKLSPQERAEYLKAVKSVDVAVYTGAADRILRRLTVNAVVRDHGKDQATSLALTLTRVNREQAIAAPQGAKPFSALLDKLGAQGALGLGFGG